jgi:hypothetical protein
MKSITDLQNDMVVRHEDVLRHMTDLRENVLSSGNRLFLRPGALSSLQNAMEARNQAAMDYGMAVLRWVLEGGTVSYLDQGPPPEVLQDLDEQRAREANERHLLDVFGADRAVQLRALRLLYRMALHQRNAALHSARTLAVQAFEVLDALPEGAASLLEPGIELVDKGGQAESTEPEEAPNEKPGHGDTPSSSDGEQASMASLIALAQRGIGGALVDTHEPKQIEVDTDALSSIVLGYLDPIRAVASAAAFHAMLDRLQAVVKDIESWTMFPLPVQRRLLGLCSSLARHLQDETSIDMPSDHRLNDLFNQMVRYSGTERPGFVPGLSRSNRPSTGSWITDAKHWRSELALDLSSSADGWAMSPKVAFDRLESLVHSGFEDSSDLEEAVHQAVNAGVSQSDKRLVDLLVPYQDTLKEASGLKTLKTQLKASIDHEEDFEAFQDAASPVPADWPYRHLTEGKVGVILGGDPRPTALARIQEAFGFAELTWEGTEPRRTASVARRVEKGTVDVVILLLRFIHHSHSDVLVPVCKNAGVPLVAVSSGYGVDAVRRSFDKVPKNILSSER